jgi:hypothetical protein
VTITGNVNAAALVNWNLPQGSDFQLNAVLTGVANGANVRLVALNPDGTNLFSINATANGSGNAVFSGNASLTNTAPTGPYQYEVLGIDEGSRVTLVYGQINLRGA